MTDNPAKTAERKRKKYVPYNEQPQKQLNVDQPYNQRNLEAIDTTSRELNTQDVAVLLRVIAQKDMAIEAYENQARQLNQTLMNMFEDIQYLKGELSNPNLYIAK